MRLNSISQAITSADTNFANVLVRYSSFPSDLLIISDGKPTLRNPARFEEVFAEAKRAHIDRERQDIISDFANKPDSLPQKKSKLKNNTKKRLLGEANLQKSSCLP